MRAHTFMRAHIVFLAKIKYICAIYAPLIDGGGMYNDN